MTRPVSQINPTQGLALRFLVPWTTSVLWASCMLSAVCCFKANGQTIIENFAGLNLIKVSMLSGFSTPPDTMGAAGTNHFVEFINGAFGVYDKAGNQLLLESDEDFWLNAGIKSGTMSAGLSDPRIFFDVRSGRWFASEITVDTTGNKVLIARSDTSDPTGGWQGTNFIGSTNDFADFDTLGVDALGVYVSASIFNAAGTSLLGQSLFCIPKTDLLSAPPSLSRMTRFDNIDDQVYGFTMQGVCNLDAGAGHGVAVAIDNASFGYMDRTTINNPGAAGATLSTPVRITLSYDTQPDNPKQPNGQTVDVPDDRFADAVWQVGGYIFCANTIAEGGKDVVHWAVLNETNNAVVGEGYIGDTNYEYFQPAIAVNHAGRIMLVFNRCGTTAPDGYISICAAVGTLSNGHVTMGTPFLVKAGTVNYTGLAGVDTTPYRWGDYSATCVDPTDEDLFWTIQEIPFAAGTWGTQITLLSMATNRPALNITEMGNTIELSWPLSTDPAYQLQFATNLTSGSTWNAVTNAPVISINQNVVTLTPAGGAAYFRLAK